jgi:2-aminoadipate transaminase
MNELTSMRAALNASSSDGVRPLYAQASGSPIRALLALASITDMVSLAGGHPDPALLPLEWLRNGLRAVLDDTNSAALQYGATEGLPALREASAAVLRSRGLRAEGAEVLITTGSQQGIDLLARVLVEPGDAVAVARFNYPAAVQSLRFAGARVVPVEGDAQGLLPDDLERQLQASGARVLYLVPSFGNPGGDLMSLERRLRLLEIAARRSVTVIEDDPYGELWFDAPPPPSLAALNQQAGSPARVAYLTSFSKTVAPALRLGVLHAPATMMRAVAIAKQAADVHSGTLEQRVLATMLADGGLPAHLAMLRTAYAAKRDTLVAALRRHCAWTLTFDKPSGGMFVWARTQPDVPLLEADAWMAFGQRHRVLVVPASAFSAEGTPQPWLRLSFAHPAAPALVTGAERLGAGLDELVLSPLIRSTPRISP